MTTTRDSFILPLAGSPRNKITVDVQVNSQCTCNRVTAKIQSKATMDEAQNQQHKIDRFLIRQIDFLNGKSLN